MQSEKKNHIYYKLGDYQKPRNRLWSDDQLDRHCRQKMDLIRNYIQNHATDIVFNLCNKWLDVFNRTSKDQAYARNHLVELMHSQLIETDQLGPPFTDQLPNIKQRKVRTNVYTRPTVYIADRNSPPQLRVPEPSYSNLSNDIKRDRLRQTSNHINRMTDPNQGKDHQQVKRLNTLKTKFKKEDKLVWQLDRVSPHRRNVHNPPSRQKSPRVRSAQSEIKQLDKRSPKAKAKQLQQLFLRKDYRAGGSELDELSVGRKKKSLRTLPKFSPRVQSNLLERDRKKQQILERRQQDHLERQKRERYRDRQRSQLAEQKQLEQQRLDSERIRRENELLERNRKVQEQREHERQLIERKKSEQRSCEQKCREQWERDKKMWDEKHNKRREIERKERQKRVKQLRQSTCSRSDNENEIILSESEITDNTDMKQIDRELCKILLDNDLEYGTSVGSERQEALILQQELRAENAKQKSADYEKIKKLNREKAKEQREKLLRAKEAENQWRQELLAQARKAKAREQEEVERQQRKEEEIEERERQEIDRVMEELNKEEMEEFEYQRKANERRRREELLREENKKREIEKFQRQKEESLERQKEFERRAREDLDRAEQERMEKVQIEIKRQKEKHKKEELENQVKEQKRNVREEVIQADRISNDKHPLEQHSELSSIREFQTREILKQEPSRMKMENLERERKMQIVPERVKERQNAYENKPKSREEIVFHQSVSQSLESLLEQKQKQEQPKRDAIKENEKRKMKECELEIKFEKNKLLAQRSNTDFNEKETTKEGEHPNRGHDQWRNAWTQVDNIQAEKDKLDQELQESYKILDVLSTGNGKKSSDISVKCSNIGKSLKNDTKKYQTEVLDQCNSIHGHDLTIPCSLNVEKENETKQQLIRDLKVLLVEKKPKVSQITANTENLTEGMDVRSPNKLKSKWDLIWSPMLKKYIHLEEKLPADSEVPLVPSSERNLGQCSLKPYTDSEIKIRRELERHLHQKLQTRSSSSREYFQPGFSIPQGERWARFMEDYEESSTNETDSTTDEMIGLRLTGGQVFPNCGEDQSREPSQNDDTIKSPDGEPKYSLVGRYCPFRKTYVVEELSTRRSRKNLLHPHGNAEEQRKYRDWVRFRVSKWEEQLKLKKPVSESPKGTQVRCPVTYCIKTGRHKCKSIGGNHNTAPIPHSEDYRLGLALNGQLSNVEEQEVFGILLDGSLEVRCETPELEIRHLMAENLLMERKLRNAKCTQNDHQIRKQILNQAISIIQVFNGQVLERGIRLSEMSDEDMPKKQMKKTSLLMHSPNNCDLEQKVSAAELHRQEIHKLNLPYHIFRKLSAPILDGIEIDGNFYHQLGKLDNQLETYLGIMLSRNLEMPLKCQMQINSVNYQREREQEENARLVAKWRTNEQQMQRRKRQIPKRCLHLIRRLFNDHCNLNDGQVRDVMHNIGKLYNNWQLHINGTKIKEFSKDR